MSELILSGDTPKTLEIVGINMKGDKPIKGVDYYTDADKEELVAEVSGTVVERFLDSANAIRGEKSGKTIKIDDISPLAHDVKITLQSAGNAQVMSKNIYDANSKMGDYLSGDEYIFQRADVGSTRYTFGEDEVGKTYTFSMLARIDTTGYESPMNILYLMGRQNGEWASDAVNGRAYPNEAYKRIYMTITPEKAGDFIEVTYGNGEAMIYTKEMQLEESSTLTGYTDYIEPAYYESDTDGNLCVGSLYPSMYLTSDMEMTARYNRDTNKVIENLQNAILALGGNV